MEIRFIKQRIAESISTLDEIELYNCEDRGMNGEYTVGDVEPDTGEVLLVGKGKLSGCITQICLGEEAT